MATNRTLSFLGSNRRLSGTEALPRSAADDPTFVKRLSYKTTSSPLDLQELSEGIAMIPPEVAIFLDNNIWDLSLGPHLWPVLLGRERGVHVVPGVRIELEPWRRRYPSFIGSIAVEERRAPLEFLDVPPEGAQRDALIYYTSLLLQRRHAFTYFAANFEQIEGRAPDAREIVEGVQRLYGERALLLAYKNGEVVVADRRATDEYLVCAAAAHGLATGQPTIVLTKDQDVLEQFYKLWWLLDTQYRAMLMADAYAADPLRYRHFPIPQTKVTSSQFHFDADAFLLDFGDRRMNKFLPSRHAFVSQECWLLQKNLTRIVFGAEREMHRLWETKGATGGLVSDRLGGRNLHAYLGGTMLERVNSRLVANCAAVVRDKTLAASESVSMSLLDITYALFSNEHFTRLTRSERENEPSRLWTPKVARRSGLLFSSGDGQSDARLQSFADREAS